MMHENMTHTGHIHTANGHMPPGGITHGHMAHGNMESGHMTPRGITHKHMTHENMESGHMINGVIKHGQVAHGNMVFSASYQRDFILKDVKISTVGGIVGAMLVVILLATFLEGFKHWLYIRQRNGPDHTQVKGKSRQFTSFWNNIARITTSLQKMLTVTVGYLLMLCVMTMNVWMLVSAVLGAGIGYLLLRPAVSACFAMRRTKHECNEIRKREEMSLVKH
ncbi:uncharacterized protein LOC128215551 [Mya arenaria]|uniref:uncharacterized protein LOC128215551 n=1 Tax=Mya arenaria TaxID=6604 RepID=UPI0022E1B9EF|nr:uncharacterized protein LOC128215551 [Mya arenaria]